MKVSSALKMLIPLAVTIMVAIFAIGVDSEVPVICGVTIPGLFKCLPAVKITNHTSPVQECCAAIRPADLTCFCKYKNSTLVKVFSIDIDLALKLPKKCKIKGAPTHCSY